MLVAQFVYVQSRVYGSRHTCGDLSDEMTALTFKTAAGPRQRSNIFRGENQYFMSSIFTFFTCRLSTKHIFKSPPSCRYLLITVSNVIVVYEYMYAKVIERLGIADHAITYVAHVTTDAYPPERSCI
jgi:hypothetical protein